jgi:SAM-dependent methyltransferase
MESRELLRALPRLSLGNAERHARACKICGALSLFFDVVDFNKCHFYAFGPSDVFVKYYRCDDCGFMFTDFFDEWTREDFGELVYNDDLPMVDIGYDGSRGRRTADELAPRLEPWRGLRVLDYGAGEGQFAARMNENGYHVESFDPINRPERPDGRFDIITCFEVFEHSPNPLQMMDDLMSFLAPDGCVVFSQTLQPANIEQIRGSWWYCGPRNGHCSFYEGRTLRLIAERYGMTYHSDGGGLHALARAGSALEALALHVGPQVPREIILWAPETAAVGWHGIEGQGHTRFRWTAAETICWPLSGSGRSLLRTPVYQEIRPGFSSGCRLVVGGRELNPIDRGQDVAALCDLSSGKHEVILRSPALTSPALELGVADNRHLGVAIRVRAA